MLNDFLSNLNNKNRCLINQFCETFAKSSHVISYISSRSAAKHDENIRCLLSNALQKMIQPAILEMTVVREVHRSQSLLCNWGTTLNFRDARWCFEMHADASCRSAGIRSSVKIKSQPCFWNMIWPSQYAACSVALHSALHSVFIRSSNLVLQSLIAISRATGAGWCCWNVLRRPVEALSPTW